MNIKPIKIFPLLLLFLSINTFSQMIIREVPVVYKSNVDGRIISENEFQSYKGRFISHKLIKNKNGRDTLLITPPNFIKPKEVLENKQITSKLTKAPSFSVTDVNGKSYNLNSLKGKVVVANFWFIACAPCLIEMPELNKLAEKYKDNSDVIFMAFAKDLKANLIKFLKDSPFQYNVIPNSDKIAALFGVKAYPTHFVINKEGTITYSSLGGFNEESIKSLVNKINQSL